MPFLTPQQEDELVAKLAQSPRCAVTVVGNSVEGRPLRLLRIGMPPPSLDDRAVLLIVAAQHGGEPSGRDAVYALAQRLTTTTDPDELDFLARHGVLLWPTANPDRILLDRLNANSADLNRQHVTLSEPEARALAVVLGRARPAIVVDMHEAFPQAEEVSFAPPINPMSSPVMVQRAQDIITACKTRATSEGWASGDYSSMGGSERTLVNVAGLRHAAGVLVEVSQDGFDQDERIAIATAMVEEIFAYAVANAAALISDADQSAADATAAGRAGTAPINLRTEVIDPPPLGYRVTVGDLAALAFHLRVFGIETGGPGGRQISMAQAAYPVIPFIVDPAAEFGTVAGARLFSLEPDPPPPATVETFAEVVSGSHAVVVEARVLSEYQTGDDPEGVTIPILGGDVMYDATAQVFATLNLVVAGIDEDTGRSRFPRLPRDLLAPYGNEVWVRRGVDLGDRVLWSPLGYFRIDDVEQQDSPYGAITITGQDRMAGIIDARLIVPRTFPPHTTVATVFATMVGEVYPDAIIAFDDETGFASIGNSLTFEEDRYAPLAELASAFGKVMYWDGEGVLRVESPPDESTPVMKVSAGRGGVLITSARRVSREGVYNAVVARGEGGAQTDPVFGVAVDIGPTSPTRWGGRFGKVPRFYTSPFIQTKAQAEDAAAAILRRQLGASFSVNFNAVPNPALRPWHPILVTQRDGNREVHVVETLTIPLAADMPMSGTTRERTHVLIGRKVDH